ncbi:hypothetical protein F5887DRAFT_517606 [Amanita rubescens]|nr:hypothetical protein F5887DRAFT_517606 [Amanita rubescens]
MELYANESANIPQSFPAKFPPELLERIIIHFIRDPYTTFDQLKSLRLVCRIFSDVAGRRVLSRVRLFRLLENPLMKFPPPLSIISLELNCDLYETSTLVADWRNVDASMFISFRQMRNSNEWVFPIICNFTLVPLIYLLRFIFCPGTLPLCIYSSINRLRSKYRLSRASVFNTPNVYRFICKTHDFKPIQKWATTSIVKLLLELHQLSELVLLIDSQQNLRHIFKCFSKLRNLRKLEIWLGLGDLKRYNPDWPSPINDLGKVIGSNPNLTHLDLHWAPGVAGSGSFSTIFSHVPAGGPLKLEHFAISNSPSDVTAIVPHLRSLTSIGILSAFVPCTLLVQVLHSERIFPPTIQMSHIDDHLVTYLSHHPRIVSLSIRAAFNEVFGRKILQIMALHSESLTYFATYSSSFISCLEHVENELSLLQCTKLEQLLLWYDYRNRIDLPGPPKLPETFIAHLPIIARLPSSLTLVYNNFKLFEACIAHCSQSEDSLIRDLKGRIVYDPAKCYWYW